jgi:hypothetical protein
MLFGRIRPHGGCLFYGFPVYFRKYPDAEESLGGRRKGSILLAELKTPKWFTGVSEIGFFQIV